MAISRETALARCQLELAFLQRIMSEMRSLSELHVSADYDLIWGSMTDGIQERIDTLEDLIDENGPADHDELCAYASVIADSRDAFGQRQGLLADISESIIGDEYARPLCFD